jgi:hypothetical protein
MPPKAHFSIPLKKASNTAIPTQRGRRSTRTTETIPLKDHVKHGASSKSSQSHPTPVECTDIRENPATDGLSDPTVETHPLHNTEAQDEVDLIVDMLENDISNVQSLAHLMQFMFDGTTDTNGSMASDPRQISQPPIRKRGSHKVSHMLCMLRPHGDQMQ